MVDGGVVVLVVVLFVVPEPPPGDVVVVVVDEPAPVVPVLGAVVVVVVGGATNGTVSPVMVAAVVEGAAPEVGAAPGLVPTLQRRRGRCAGQGLRQPGQDGRRPERGRRDVTADGGEDQRAARCLRRGVVVEGEVAQAVVDVCAAEVAAAQEHVGVGSYNDVRSRLDQLLGQRLLLGVRTGLGLGAPVDVDDHRVGRAPDLLHLAYQRGRVDRRSDAPLCRRGGPGADEIAFNDLRSGDDRDPLSVDGDPVRRERLRRVVADADDGEGGLRGDRQILREPLGPAIEAVVVRLGYDVDARALERGDRGWRSVEGVLLVLGLGADVVVGEHGLEVHHAQLCARQQLRDRCSERRRGVLGQAAADDAGEVHVTAEREGDRFAASFPVWIERGVLGEGLIDRRMGGRRRGSRCLSRSAGEEHEEDQQEEDQGAAGGELAPASADPAGDHVGTMSHEVARGRFAGREFRRSEARTRRKRRGAPRRMSGGGHAAQSESQWSVSEATRPRHPAAIMSRHSSKSTSSP